MSRSVVCRRFNDAELKFCYPDKRGLVFPDFTDNATLQELNYALPTYLGLKPSGGTFRMLCPDGKSHKFGLFLDDNGRYLIRDFQYENYLFGRYAEYSCDIVGLELARRGLPQTEDNVFALVDARDGKEREAIEPLLKYDLSFNRKPKEEILRTKEEIKTLNSDVLRNAVDEKILQFARKEGDSVETPTLLKEALSKRGIEIEKLNGYFDKIGFSTGLKLYNQNGNLMYAPLCGVVFMLDSIGDIKGGMQIRLMQEKKEGDKLEWEYISKADEEKDKYAHRYFNLGAAMTFGLNNALSNPGKPIIVTEGIFDALSIISVSNGKVSAVALQGCGNHKYFTSNISKFKETNTPIVIALDEDRAGVNGRDRLEKELKEAGCMSIKWPGCLGYSDMNDLLQKDANVAKNLVNVVATVTSLASKNLLTPLITRGVLKAVTGGRLDAYVKEGSQSDYANLVMQTLSKEGARAKECVTTFNKDLAQFLAKNKSVQDAYKDEVRQQQNKKKEVKIFEKN